MKKLLVILMAISLQASWLYAQERRITGKVMDEEGEGLPGATVLVKGTENGTITDLDGNYAISASEGDILTVSFVGFEAQEFTVGSSTIINATLRSDLQALDEVVVIGYGEMKRSDVTGSVVSVKGEDLQLAVAASFDQALQGRAAGLVVQQNSGQPGGGVSIRIRGVSSISGNNEPLYVIDGVPVQGDQNNNAIGFSWAGGGNGQTALNALAGINPNDIESVEVLKDASATAIYGSRASNGVVLITTKRGKSGGTKVTYDGYYGLQKFPKKLDVLNLQQFAQFSNEVAEAEGWTPRPEFGDPSILGEGTDWQEEIYELAGVHNHNLAFSGGSQNTKYNMTLGYMDQDGIIIGSGFERISARLNLDHKVNDWLSVGASISGSNTQERVTLNDDVWGVVSLGLSQTPNVPVRNSNGEWGGPDPGTGNQQLNPVAVALIRDLRVKRNRILSNLFLNAEIIDGLKFTSKVGIDKNETKNYGFNPTYEMGEAPPNNQNQSQRSIGLSNYWIWSNYLTYKKDLTSSLSINAMLGQEAQSSNWEGISGTRKNFITNDIHPLNAGDAITATNNNYQGSHALSSYYGRLNLDIADKFLITSTFRADGSSNFAKGNKWGFFPSFAVGYRLSEEGFMDGISAISNLKLRAGYGEVGNQDIGGYRYGTALRNYPTKWGSGLLANNYGNPELVWESSRQINAGIDLSLFGNRIEMIIDAYKKFNTDALMQQPLPMYMGSGIAAPWVNIGELENRGIELTLNTVNTTGAIEWKSGLTATVNRDKITKLNTEGAIIDRTVQFFDHVTRSEIGQPVGQFYGYVTDGLFEDAEDIEGSALPTNISVDRRSGVWVGDQKFKDLNGDGEINAEDRTYIGNPNPKVVLGLNNSVNYKQFDVTVFITSKLGHDLYNYTRSTIENLSWSNNQSVDVLDRAKLGLKSDSGDPDNVQDVVLQNPGATIPRSTNVDGNDNNRISDRFVEDGSYVRLQNITFGYSLPQDLLGRFQLSKVRVYVNLQNVFTLTGYKGYDPEIGPYNQDSFLAGVDNGNYPAPRIYTAGINIGL
ncbi:TonB-linked SusC/RagA family outer membrane protein [Marinoscillum furvescens DSM 4134]|uniref:TonB-linked SusC/RagA family outer membrane protein n=2 Tax=Marinoscillum furvescens TaxID=1026 RepID=A0A3D9KWB1_MARFU|nr:TonB-linked SusC/RagA family outer membrane protein [Marinoscillum furvescens DSM 4134]